MPSRTGFCATMEKDWQGNPPVRISNSGISSLFTSRISLLSGITPKTAKTEEDIFEDFGYYYDENRYKRFGAIPKTQSFKTNYTTYAEPRYDYMRTSDPRYYM